MKKLSTAAALCASMFLSGLAVAKTSTAVTPMKLTLSGDGRWSVRCTFEVGNGLIDRQEFRGGKAAPVVFTSPNFKHGSCDYKAASDKSLTISVEGNALACPFSSPADAKCEQALTPGAAGSFRVTPRGEK